MEKETTFLVRKPKGKSSCVLYSIRVRATLGLQSVSLPIPLTEKAFRFCHHLDSKCALLRELRFDLCSCCLRMTVRQTRSVCTGDLLSAPQVGQGSRLGCLAAPCIPDARV